MQILWAFFQLIFDFFCVLSLEEVAVLTVLLAVSWIQHLALCLKGNFTTYFDILLQILYEKSLFQCSVLNDNNYHVPSATFHSYYFKLLTLSLPNATVVEYTVHCSPNLKAPLIAVYF